MEQDLLIALIIEDEVEIATILASALQSAGFETVLVQDGEAALAQLRMIVPTLVVLDLALPEVSGTEVLLRLRADESLKGTRVIVITGMPVLIDGVEDLADLVLVKPFSITQVRDFAVRLATAKGMFDTGD
jgi:DNA-binding response OmpR family regulator